MAKVQTDALIQKKKTPGFIVRRVLLYVVLIVIGLTMLVPFLWMISTSLKEQYGSENPARVDSPGTPVAELCGYLHGAAHVPVHAQHH